ncbi:MAG: PDZ domain-containing protein, partial [Rhodospirillales bacterium]|nr:PDZ domain-containing protein [Rhodospirillales bacterium]
LVGINTAIFSKSGGSHGIGFAIPSNMVRAVVAGTVKGGRLLRAWLGALGQAVNQDIASTLGMSRPSGVMIKRVHPKGPAALAGLKAGDVILRVNDNVVDDPKALEYRIATLIIGEKAELEVLRRGKKQSFILDLTPPPEEPPRDLRKLTGQHPLSGTLVANMSPALADEMGIETFEDGVYVLRLEDRSYASRMGLNPGDRIISINGEEIDSTQFLERVMKMRVNSWAISIKRGGKVMKLVVDR